MVVLYEPPQVSTVNIILGLNLKMPSKNLASLWLVEPPISKICVSEKMDEHFPIIWGWTFNHHPGFFLDLKVEPPQRWKSAPNFGNTPWGCFGPKPWEKVATSTGDRMDDPSINVVWLGTLKFPHLQMIVIDVTPPSTLIPHLACACPAFSQALRQLLKLIMFGRILPVFQQLLVNLAWKYQFPRYF